MKSLRVGERRQHWKRRNTENSWIDLWNWLCLSSPSDEIWWPPFWLCRFDSARLSLSLYLMIYSPKEFFFLIYSYSFSLVSSSGGQRKRWARQSAVNFVALDVSLLLVPKTKEENLGFFLIFFPFFPLISFISYIWRRPAYNHCVALFKLITITPADLSHLQFTTGTIHFPNATDVVK